MPSLPTIPPLPIDDALPALTAALAASRNVVLHAPPGAGKTTRVPLALLDDERAAPAGHWLAGQRILMLEPRRLATRAAASRMAWMRGETVGETVGYRIRMESRVGPATRVEVVTEGILARMLRDDPSLDGVGLVIFDEFHERSLYADAGLALTLHSQRLLREDVRILVMSATLDTAAVAVLLDGAPVVSSEGRAYPVDVRYLARPAAPTVRIETTTAAAIRSSLVHDVGDVLVFLPGAGEIRRTEALLREGEPLVTHTPGETVRIMPLAGTLTNDAQDAAIAPSVPGTRKVVLSTSIAETSLTIEGIRVVIDAGLMRVPKFSPRTGMTRLETVRVTHASSEQRRGRAGRLGPGICYRLWTELEQAQLVPFGRPEIMDADLAPLALELAAHGIPDPAELPWLDVPPTAAFSHARALLRQLGALDAEGRITAHGTRMAALAAHPRITHMLLRAEAAGHGLLACQLAALLNERDLLFSDAGPPDGDIRLRIEALQSDAARGGGHRGLRVDHGVRQRVLTETRSLARQLGVSAVAPVDVDACGWVLAFAYPDRIAQRRPGTQARYLLRSGRGALFATPQTLSVAPYVVVAELDGQSPESRIFLAAPIELTEIESHFGDQVERQQRIAWDGVTRTVRATAREQLGAITLAETRLRTPDPDAMVAALLDGIAAEGLHVLPWTDHARQTQARLQFVRARVLDTQAPDAEAWPDVSDAALATSLPAWLGPHIGDRTSLDALRSVDVAEALLSLLSWEQRMTLDARAPTHYTAPTGSRIAIDYSNASAPVVSIRLQELFGETETPTVDRGAVPVTLHLLSPAHRPVQVTRDLAGFWETSYFAVRKDLRGRYPKHAWPDDPLQALPTRHAKRRGE